MAEIKTFKNKGETGAIPLNAENVNETIKAFLEIFGVDIDNYSNTKTYAVGDIVIYKHKLYECTTAITTAETFDENKWSFVPLIEEFKINPKLIPKKGKSLYENPDGVKIGKITLKDSIENYKYILVLTNIGSFIYYCGNKEHIEFFVSCFAYADQVYNNAMVVGITNNELSITNNKSWYGSTVIEGNSVRNVIYEIIGFNEL